MDPKEGKNIVLMIKKALKDLTPFLYFYPTMPG